MTIRNDIDVYVTSKAQSKSYRLLDPSKCRDLAYRAALGRAKRVYRRTDSDDAEYHILSGPYAVVVKVDDPTTLVVVTQMHQHASYGRTDTYERVDGISETLT